MTLPSIALLQPPKKSPIFITVSEKNNIFHRVMWAFLGFSWLGQSFTEKTGNQEPSPPPPLPQFPSISLFSFYFSFLFLLCPCLFTHFLNFSSLPVFLLHYPSSFLSFFPPPPSNFLLLSPSGFLIFSLLSHL